MAFVRYQMNDQVDTAFESQSVLVISTKGHVRELQLKGLGSNNNFAQLQELVGPQVNTIIIKENGQQSFLGMYANKRGLDRNLRAMKIYSQLSSKKSPVMDGEVVLFRCNDIIAVDKELGEIEESYIFTKHDLESFRQMGISHR